MLLEVQHGRQSDKHCAFHRYCAAARLDKHGMAPKHEATCDHDFNGMTQGKQGTNTLPSRGGFCLYKP